MAGAKKNAASKTKTASKTYKNKGTVKKTKGAASLQAEVIANLTMMLNKHYKELCNALAERHNLLIKNLQYDRVSISKRSDADNNLARRQVQAGSRSPSEIIEATRCQVSGEESREDLNATPKKRLVKTYSKKRYFADTYSIGVPSLSKHQRCRK